MMGQTDGQTPDRCIDPAVESMLSQLQRTPLARRLFLATVCKYDVSRHL